MIAVAPGFGAISICVSLYHMPVLMLAGQVYGRNNSRGPRGGARCGAATSDRTNEEGPYSIEPGGAGSATDMYVGM